MKRDTPERVTEEGEGEPESIKKPRQDHDGGKVIYDAYKENVLDRSILYGLMNEFHFSVHKMVSAVIEHAVRGGMDATACSRMSGTLCEMAMDAIKEKNDREQQLTKIGSLLIITEMFTFPAIRIKDFPKIKQRKAKYRTDLWTLVGSFDEKLKETYKHYIGKMKYMEKNHPHAIFFVSHPGGQCCINCKNLLMKLSYENQANSSETVISTPLCYFCAHRYALDIEKHKILKEAEEKQAEVCNTLTDFLNVMPKTFQ